MNSPSSSILQEGLALLTILGVCAFSLWMKALLLFRFGWGNRRRSFWIAFGLQLISAIVSGGTLAIAFGVLFAGGIGARSVKEFEDLFYRFVIPFSVFGIWILPTLLYSWILFLTRTEKSKSYGLVGLLLVVLEGMVWLVWWGALFFLSYKASLLRL